MSIASSDIKPEARKIVDDLPAGATWADLMYLIYARQQIEAGIEDADEGRMVTTEQLRANLGLKP